MGPGIISWPPGIDGQILMMIPYRKNLAHKLNRRGETMTTPMTCEHDGENCNGAEFCNTCQVQIFSGYIYGDERYCNDHKPATWDAELAEMSSEEFDDQDDMYWTQFEICDIFCDCPVDCPCRPAPEALQALYDADRARSEAENKDTLFCELCEDERLAEDINEDGRCPLCEEREEKNENGI
tara:strand:+ start:926 stop:1471 length:546 start_codon:yes stop_codon:yes gene_type:complete